MEPGGLADEAAPATSALRGSGLVVLITAYLAAVDMRELADAERTTIARFDRRQRRGVVRRVIPQHRNGGKRPAPCSAHNFGGARFDTALMALPRFMASFSLSRGRR